MKAFQAQSDCESREWVIVDETNSPYDSFFAPPTGRGARNKSPYTTELETATVYKTREHALSAIKRNELNDAWKVASLYEYQNEAKERQAMKKLGITEAELLTADDELSNKFRSLLK